MSAAITLRDGRYALLGTLGSGSQGDTLEAVDKREGRPVAIKRFTIRGAKSWKDVELAEREATVLSALNHAGLPRYIEHFEEEGALYLVMEKIEGETLASRRKRGAMLTQEQVLRFLREAAECLRYLHGHAPPIVHRDIKPGNVILRPDGSYCLVDFGSVRDRLKPEGGSTVVGTFGFMAPEQFQGRAGPASDVYAVGATAVSLLTGSEPEDLPHKGLRIDVEAALSGAVDRRLIGALRSMLEPDPDARAQSLEQALSAHGLSEASSGERARPATRRAERRARRAARQHRPGEPVLPGKVLGVFLLIVFQVARLAAFALFQVLLPTLFTLLTIVGGKRMHQRGRRMIDVGRAGDRGLRRASQHVRYQFMGGPTPQELATESEADEAAQPTAPDPETRPRRSLEAELEDIEQELEREIETAIEDFADARQRRR